MALSKNSILAGMSIEGVSQIVASIPCGHSFVGTPFLGFFLPGRDSSGTEARSMESAQTQPLFPAPVPACSGRKIAHRQPGESGGTMRAFFLIALSLLM